MLQQYKQKSIAFRTIIKCFTQISSYIIYWSGGAGLVYIAVSLCKSVCVYMFRKTRQKQHKKTQSQKIRQNNENK